MSVSQTEVILRHGGLELAHASVAPGAYVIGAQPGGAHLRRHGTFFAGQRISDSTRLLADQAIQLGDVSLEIRGGSATVHPPATARAAAENAPPFLPAELLNERRYAIGAQVARGGMGAILAAEQTALQRPVAMKVMLDDTAVAEDVRRFVKEAQVTHPNIVPVYELGVDERGQVFYTMKMVRGITLKKVLALLAEGVAATVKKYPLAALLTIFQKACDAVAFAHSKGILHRDLKPENIMLGDFGEVLVMDWGLAKQTRKSEVGGRNEQLASAPDRSDFPLPTSDFRTLDGAIMGTPAYMSP